MPDFMIAYHGGRKPNSKDEGMARMEKWKAWIEKLGESVINPGTPLPVSKIVTSTGIEDDNDPNSMNGFAVLNADSIDAAVNMIKSDPFLETGGRIRISQMTEMP